MAVSRKRKGAVRSTGSSRVKLNKAIAKEQAENAKDPTKRRWAMKLHSSRLIYLKNDPDFITMVKMGRVMNSLTFCLTSIVTFKEIETNRAHMRQMRRAQIMMGGFLHEAVELVNSFKGRYLGVDEFEPLRQLVLGYDTERVRKRAKKVRNYMAFHLDGYDETTRETVSRLKPTMHTLWSGEDMTYGGHYFEFADFLDMSFLGDVFPDPEGCDAEESGRRTLNEIFGYGVEFIAATHKFQMMLWERVREHTY